MMMVNQGRKKWKVRGVWWFQGGKRGENPDDAAIPTRFPPPSNGFSDPTVAVVVIARERWLPNSLSSSLNPFLMLAVFKMYQFRP